MRFLIGLGISILAGLFLAVCLELRDLYKKDKHRVNPDTETSDEWVDLIQSELK